MTDRTTVQLVVCFLGVATLAGMALVGTLAYQTKTIPDALIALTSGALAAVAALLSRTGSDQPTGVSTLSDEDLDAIAGVVAERSPVVEPPV